jgi:hypothetical protein
MRNPSGDSDQEKTGSFRVIVTLPSFIEQLMVAKGKEPFSP